MLIATQNGFVDVVKLLLENGADVHAQTVDKGFFPLYASIERNHEGTIVYNIFILVRNCIAAAGERCQSKPANLRWLYITLCGMQTQLYRNGQIAVAI